MDGVCKEEGEFFSREPQGRGGTQSLVFLYMNISFLDAIVVLHREQ